MAITNLHKVHKEGRMIIFCLFIILGLIDLALFVYTPKLLFYIITFFSIIIFFLVTNFFRSPKRLYTGDKDDVVVAPSDGQIVTIEEVFESEYFKEKRIQVSIFMTVFNVHAQWSPMNGEVLVSQHHSGRFMAAYLPKSSTENERSTIVIKNDKGISILMRQVAGALARRIVTYCKAGDRTEINDQLGFIKFGSRIDLYLPLDSEILVKMNEKVTGNITTIAKLKK